jgi:hypothetical protein
MEEKTLWEQSEWRQGAEDWLLARLSEHKITVTGSIEQIHLQVWSTVLKVPTERGFYFFKAGSATQHFEPALLELLAQRRPGDTLTPLAIDAARGWSLLPDGGPTMRQHFGQEVGFEQWKRILAAYARLQIAASQWQPELAATGLPLRGLASIPAQLAKILDDGEISLVREEEDFLSVAHFEKLRNMGAELAQISAELAASGIPESLEHGDLHDGNTFASGLPFDWGDASWSFPFFTLIIPIRFAADKLGVSEYADHPALIEMRDAYLNEWLAFASHAKLVKAWERSSHLGKYVRALNWYHTVKGNGVPGHRYEGWVSGWLLEGLQHKQN